MIFCFSLLLTFKSCTEIQYGNIIEFIPNIELIINFQQKLIDLNKQPVSYESILQNGIETAFTFDFIIDLEKHLNNFLSYPIKLLNQPYFWEVLVSTTTKALPLDLLKDLKKTIEKIYEVLTSIEIKTPKSSLPYKIKKYLENNQIEQFRFDQLKYYKQHYLVPNFNFFFITLVNKNYPYYTLKLLKAQISGLSSGDQQIYTTSIEPLLIELDNVKKKLKNKFIDVPIDYNSIYNFIQFRNLDLDTTFSLAVLHKIQYKNIPLLNKVYLELIEIFSQRIEQYEKTRSEYGMKMVNEQLRNSKYYFNNQYLGYNKQLELNKANNLLGRILNFLHSFSSQIQSSYKTSINPSNSLPKIDCTQLLQARLHKGKSNIIDPFRRKEVTLDDVISDTLSRTTKGGYHRNILTQPLSKNPETSNPNKSTILYSILSNPVNTKTQSPSLSPNKIVNTIEIDKSNTETNYLQNPPISRKPGSSIVNNLINSPEYYPSLYRPVYDQISSHTIPSPHSSTSDRPLSPDLTSVTLESPFNKEMDLDISSDQELFQSQNSPESTLYNEAMDYSNSRNTPKNQRDLNTPVNLGEDTESSLYHTFSNPATFISLNRTDVQLDFQDIFKNGTL